MERFLFKKKSALAEVISDKMYEEQENNHQLTILLSLSLSASGTLQGVLQVEGGT